MSNSTSTDSPSSTPESVARSRPAPGRTDSSRLEFFQMMAWRWDITTAKKLTRDRTPEGRIEPGEWAGMLQLVAINREHAAQVDLSEPLIVATVPNGGMLIIDGWHRLYKALNAGIPELLAVVLTAEEELACRMHGGEKGDGYLR
ncbi:ParB N-terminal domain-containing protein [Nonomuraea sp. NN258]|uniref:ParB N-terminal domain-containing protein n=1 Tax=Nonomuraea antri TaxID=2730852 RepID=UPI001568CC8A|nr:ParB N-terminal domain-containing protein [Nonomuraea antri]NRQ38433.1 ParB N-terminal domain-containing protein [Nonomuraea antri]